MDPDRLSIERDGERVTVEPKTMAVLLALAARPGEVLSADELIESVWEGRALGDNPVYGAIAKLRRAMDDDAREPRYIETVARRGYRLRTSALEPPAARRARGWRPPAAVAAVVAVAFLAALLWQRGVRDDAERATTAPDPPTIAVTPFANVSGDPAYDYFGAGFSEEILNTLARIEGLRVIARTSAFAFGPGEPEIPELAAALGAGYILMGSVHPEKERLRVSARLVAADGRQIWAESYDGALGRSLDVRRRVADAIATRLSVTMTPEGARASVADAALQSYLAGREFTRLGLLRHAEEAIATFRQAIEVEPDYADAHAGLARALVHEGRSVEARRHAERALELDPGAAEAHVAQGLLAFRSSGADRVSVAEAHFREALSRNPSESEARQYLAMVLAASGRRKDAMSQRELGVARDPLHYGLNRALAIDYADRGETERAVSLLERTLRWPQPDEPALFNLGQVYWGGSRHAELALLARSLEGGVPTRVRAVALATVTNSLGRLGLSNEARDAYRAARDDSVLAGAGRGSEAARTRPRQRHASRLPLVVASVRGARGRARGASPARPRSRRADSARGLDVRGRGAHPTGTVRRGREPARAALRRTLSPGVVPGDGSDAVPRPGLATQRARRALQETIVGATRGLRTGGARGLHRLSTDPGRYRAPPRARRRRRHVAPPARRSARRGLGGGTRSCAPTPAGRRCGSRIDSRPCWTTRARSSRRNARCWHPSKPARERVSRVGSICYHVPVWMRSRSTSAFSAAGSSPGSTAGT